MLFTDPQFLFYFLPASLLIYRGELWLSRAARFSIVPLGLYFCGNQHPWWILPFLGVGLLGFLGGLEIERNLLPSRVRWTGHILLHAGVLLSFKLGGLLPAGISFYTLESLSYVVDVGRKKIPAEKNLFTYLSFLAVFPRFIAGPIVRYAEIARPAATISAMRVLPGLAQFAQGLFLKTCLADRLAVFAGTSATAAAKAGGVAWLTHVAYCLQLYFDFSGYSRMAIGLGKCFGFTFPENFDRPFLAVTPQDFWNRWHRTLTFWLRDYVFFPLVRHVAPATALVLTFFVSALWHGPRLNYVVWGLWHAAWLIAFSKSRWLARRATMFKRLLTLTIVFTGLAVFRADDLRQAFAILRGLFSPAPDGGLNALLAGHVFDTGIFAAALIYCFCFEGPPRRDAEYAGAAPPFQFLCSMVSICANRAIPFLYFQF